ncbi:hypothetical protein FOCC_FOCC014612 [Frankliniella occidentalis]|nr:hypothetical protein FOCC_FOCC014612 [Frankliniella occidentalis]
MLAQRTKVTMFRITLLAVVALAAVALAHPPPHHPHHFEGLEEHKPTLGEKAAHAVGVVADKIHAAGSAVKGAILEAGHKVHVAADKARISLAKAIIPHHPVPKN